MGKWVKITYEGADEIVLSTHTKHWEGSEEINRKAGSSNGKFMLSTKTKVL